MSPNEYLYMILRRKMRLTMLTTLGTKFMILADLWTFDFLWTWSCQFWFDLILLIFWSLKKDLWFLMTFDFWFRHLLLFFSNTFLPQNLHMKANSYFEVSTIRKNQITFYKSQKNQKNQKTHQNQQTKAWIVCPSNVWTSLYVLPKNYISRSSLHCRRSYKKKKRFAFLR